MRPRASFRVAALAVLAAAIPGCVPDLSVITVGLIVQIHFTEFHGNVSASWTASMDSSNYSISGNMSASGQLPGIGNVEPPQFEIFPTETGLQPGTWTVRVTAFDGSTGIIDITCNNVDMGDIGLTSLYTLRVLEDSDDCISASGTVEPPTPPLRDVEALAINAPAAAVIGQTVNIDVDIRNNGEVDENIGVVLTMQPPGGGTPTQIAETSRIVAVGASDTVIFTWDTSCLTPEGGHLLVATVSAPNDSTANNNRSAVVQLTADRELQLLNLTDPGTVSPQVGGTLFTADLVNGNSVAEPGIDVQFNDASSEAPGTIQWLPAPPYNLACGESRQLQFSYFPPGITGGVVHTLSLTITNTIPGDDPVDNSVSVSVTITP